MSAPDAPEFARIEAIRRASGRAWLVGAAVGGIAGLVTVAISVLGVICCFLHLVALLVPAVAGLVAGLIAAHQRVYGHLGPGEGMWVGAGLGARAGATAGGFAYLGPLLLGSVAVVWVFASVRPSSTEIGALAAMIGVWFLIVAGSVALAVALGAAAGAVVGEVSQPLVTPERRAPPAPS